MAMFRLIILLFKFIIMLKGIDLLKTTVSYLTLVTFVMFLDETFNVFLGLRTK